MLKLNTPTQLDLLSAAAPRVLHPTRISVPALVADTAEEDRINRVLAEASAEAAGEGVCLSVIVPAARLADRHELKRLLRSVLEQGASSYFLWTPESAKSDYLTAASCSTGSCTPFQPSQSVAFQSVTFTEAMRSRRSTRPGSKWWLGAGAAPDQPPPAAQ